MAKIKKFSILRVPISVEYQRPLLGRLISMYAWIKYVKLFKYECFGRKFYILATPKYEVI